MASSARTSWSVTYRILCPTDLSKASERALSYAVSELAGEDAEVHLLHVDDLPTYGLPGGSVLEDPLRVAWHEALQELGKRYGESVPVKVAMRSGKPAVEIGSYAADEDVDVLVMATRGRPALARVFLGAVTDKVVRTAPVPVITLDPEARAEAIESILCPVDFSPASDAALAAAVRLAELHGAKVHLLHVCQRPQVGDGFPAGSGFFDASLEQTLQRSASQRLTALQDQHPGVIASVHVTVGFPHETIAAHAEDADLVVMGSHGRAGLWRYVLGSVAERVIRAAKVPVMVVRTAESDE